MASFSSCIKLGPLSKIVKTDLTLLENASDLSRALNARTSPIELNRIELFVFYLERLSE